MLLRAIRREPGFIMLRQHVTAKKEQVFSSEWASEIPSIGPAADTKRSKLATLFQGSESTDVPCRVSTATCTLASLFFSFGQRGSRQNEREPSCRYPAATKDNFSSKGCQQCPAKESDETCLNKAGCRFRAARVRFPDLRLSHLVWKIVSGATSLHRLCHLADARSALLSELPVSRTKRAIL